MSIGKIGTQPFTPQTEIETTAVKPPSSETSPATGASESPEQTSIAQEPSTGNAPRLPLGDPMLKAVMSNKLNAAGGGYTAPSTRMRDNFVDDENAGGADTGPSPGDATGKEGSDNLGFSLSGPSRFEGDGPTKHPSGGSTTGGASSSSSSTSTGPTSNPPSSSGGTTPSGSHHKK
jgi:hypothetical protein